MINELKKHSFKFWFVFWMCSGLFLTGWFLFWEITARGLLPLIENATDVLPIEYAQKKDYKALASVGDFFVKNRNREISLMVLFQNNMEIRPGGGFIGAFGIVKVKNGKIISMETHDLSNFDKQIPNNITAPYPLVETGVAESWKMRDSNFSPDFAVNAKKAEEFYRLGQGKEKIDGIVGITSDVLVSILKLTGPISVEGYPGIYNSENAVLSLEYQVEQAFEDQGINKAERKSVMTDLAREIEKKVVAFNVLQKIKLVGVLLSDLDQKDIQLNFKDTDLQKVILKAQWAGAVDEDWNKDYLMTVDANMGSFKSDFYVRRSIDYSVDLSQDRPRANLKITYEHTAKQKDWMTRDYTTYLRVYVPKDSQFISQQNFDGMKIEEEFGKKYFGAIVKVPIGETRSVEIDYFLPQSVTGDYSLKIQKQAGLNNTPVVLHLIDKNGDESNYAVQLNVDMILGYQK